MKTYVLTKSAEADLREVVRYTLNEWGEAQCSRYVAALEKQAEAVATGNGVFKVMDELLPTLRVALSGKHIFFACLKRRGRQLFWRFCMKEWM